MKRRLQRASLYLSCVLAFAAAGQLSAAPLDQRHAAIDRALAFLYTTASEDKVFESQGSDLLWCFYTISHTARDRQLRETAGRMGRELAVRWRTAHNHVPENAKTPEIYDLVLGAYAAERLGLPDPGFKTELRAAAGRFSAIDFLGFDAPNHGPALDDPQRYDKYSGALIKTFFGDAYGVPLGASYADVLQWLPQLRPYDGHDEDMEFDIFYAITHVIYTLDAYHEHRIAASLLPQEIQFLRQRLEMAIDDEDPEQVGEAIDCLKAAGYGKDAQVKKGMEYLVSSQRPDGAWAGDHDDVYTQYHSAWTGIDGLREYRFHGKVKRLPKN